MPITANRAGAGSPASASCARITVASAALSTAAHTDDSALHTCGTSSMPRMSALATRASS